MVGVLGGVIGLVVGYLVCEAQIHFQFFKLDTSVYIIPALPVSMHLSDFVVVGMIAVIISTLAALYPARRAAQVEPANAVRWE